jgi:hypothetical protein
MVTGFKEQAKDMTGRYSKEILGDKASKPHFEPVEQTVHKMPDIHMKRHK